MAPPPAAHPLGVFDSGLGGLTVVRALRRAMPAESIVYLGDTARVPYGTRSAHTVVRYALSCAGLLARRGVKGLVVACNTVSAVALDVLRVELDLPVLGVIEPGARAAVAALAADARAVGGDGASGRIGVLGTPGTIASGAYARAVAALTTRVEVVGRAAPLLVPLVEEGWTDGEVPRLAVRRYLEPLLRAGARVVVLGCTHYPLLRPIVEAEAAAIAGEPVRVVDSAEAAAEAAAVFFAERGRLAPPGATGTLDLLVTDLPGAFADLAARFLGEVPASVEQVDL